MDVCHAPVMGEERTGELRSIQNETSSDWLGLCRINPWCREYVRICENPRNTKKSVRQSFSSRIGM